MSQKKVVSVIMPVAKNANSVWFKAAVASIKKQTLPGVELLVEEDDGRGVTAMLNKLAGQARGEFLARMDADDSSEPDRLEKQVAYLRSHPEVVLVGSWASLIDETGRKLGVQRMPVSWREIKRAVFWRNPVIHPSWCCRRGWFERVGGYDERFSIAQDWELISRRVWTDRMENLSESLVRLRIHRQSVSFQRNREQVWANLRIQWGMIRRGNVSERKLLSLLLCLPVSTLPLRIKYALRRFKVQ